MKNFITLRQFILDHRREYLLGVFWVFFVDLIGLVTPKLLGHFIDALKQGELDSAGVLKYVGLILFIAVFVGFARYYWRIYIMGTARKAEVYLRDRLYRHLQTLSPNYFNHHKTGDLMAHATNDLNAVRMAMGPGFLSFVDPMFVLTFTTIMMIYTVGVKLTLFALAPMPLLAVTVTLFGRVIHRRFGDVQHAFGKLTDRVQESFAGARVVKTFVQEDAEIAKFTADNRENYNANNRLNGVNSLYNPLVQIVSTLAFLIALSYGGILVIRGDITLGEFVSFNTYLALMTWPMMAIGFVINMWQRGAASMERLNTIFHIDPEIRDEADMVDKDDLDGAIEYRNLTFTYPGAPQPALKNVSVRIEPGQTLAIIGRTGSGKSTLVNLLLRLYNPERGQLLLDGVDINQVPLQTLRENIGHVPQENFLFSKTIRDNIAFSGTGKQTQDQVEAAASIAQVHGNIVDFPNGYETMLGERGVTLSGGQKQRVSIARAVLKNPKILILDDSLSAVDTHTEEEILRGLKRIMQDRTSILIAHRISTIKDADEILVLDEGEIIERGRHDELLANQGLYYELYQKQLLEDSIAAAHDEEVSRDGEHS
jgi:ATP-binding cassette, subfamily B, multidrug efflux pump